MDRQFYGYYINQDERGDFYADVRDADGQTVFDIHGMDIFEDGFMRSKSDLAGLTGYLRDLGVIPRNGDVLSMVDFEVRQEMLTVSED